VSLIKSNENAHEVKGVMLGRLWLVAYFKLMPQNLSGSVEEKYEKL
jgi:hypothetical protein